MADPINLALGFLLGLLFMARHKLARLAHPHYWTFCVRVWIGAFLLLSVVYVSISAKSPLFALQGAALVSTGIFGVAVLLVWPWRKPRVQKRSLPPLPRDRAPVA